MFDFSLFLKLYFFMLQQHSTKKRHQIRLMPLMKGVLKMTKTFYKLTTVLV